MKDFDILITPSQQHDLFKKISPGQTPLNLEQFKASLPLIGIEYAKAKTKEIKNRLRELKNVLEYPESKISLFMEKIINDVADKPEDGKPLKLNQKKTIP